MKKSLIVCLLCVLLLWNGCSKKYDKTSEALTEIAIYMMEEGDFAGALKPLNEAIEIKPDSPKAHYALAVAYIRKKDPDTELARKHYELALRYGYRVPEWFLPYLERMEKSQ